MAKNVTDGCVSKVSSIKYEMKVIMENIKNKR
jgi:hypothetical protein